MPNRLVYRALAKATRTNLARAKWLYRQLSPSDKRLFDGAIPIAHERKRLLAKQREDESCGARWAAARATPIILERSEWPVFTLADLERMHRGVTGLIDVGNENTAKASA